MDIRLILELIGSVACASLLFLYFRTRLQVVRLSMQVEGEEKQNVRLTETFERMSNQALEKTQKNFLELAAARFETLQERSEGAFKEKEKAIDALIKPIKESLEKTDRSHNELRRQLVSTYSSLSEQVKGMLSSQTKLQSETHNLVKALRAPHVRGRWGEMQLKRVVEMVGMVEHCDFTQQETRGSDEGRLRPDMVVNLPGHKQIVVDSKAPLSAYLDSLEVEDDEKRKGYLRDHAKQVRTHVQQLSSKGYWSQFPKAPEFVVLFLPGETFFSAALEQDPTLIEFGVEHSVVIATPTTLISLLRSVSYGWRQELLAENAEKISALGKELYERLEVLSSHFIDMRKGLQRAVAAYNQSVGSFESRVMVTARKFQDSGVQVKKEIKELEQVDSAPRALSDAS